MPIKQHVINISMSKIFKCKRVSKVRRFEKYTNGQIHQTMKHRLKTQEQIKRFMLEKFSLGYLEKLEGLWKYVSQVNQSKRSTQR